MLAGDSSLSGPEHDIVFYDGVCGMCHWLVKFTLPRDRAGVFRFAQLQGDVFLASLTASERAGLPDSVVVKTRDGKVLVRAAAARYILGRLGWFWRMLGAVMGIVPRAVGDWVYDWIARVRHRVFKKPTEACPLVPVEYRGRLL